MEDTRPEGRRLKLCALSQVAAAALLLCLTPAASQAQQPSGDNALLSNRLVSDPNAQMFVEAEQMVYDYDNESVTARGNVQIYYDGKTIEADEVTYYQSDRTVVARGKVKITEPTGNIIYADDFKFTDDLRDGFVRSLTVVTPEDARFVAANAERQDGNITIFNKGSYTACRPCQENPEKPPTWRISASRIIHDQKEKVVYYEKPRFEFLGVPIAGLPYFSHADPSVKRKSGFLTPSIIVSDNLGYGVEIPYFFALAPNYDLTLSAVPLSHQGLLGKAEWRHRLEHGWYNLRFTGINQQDPWRFTAPGNRDWRGSFESTGRFDINKMWSWGWDAILVSDETYMRQYKLNDSTERRSRVFLTGLGERSYFNAQASYYKLMTYYNPAAQDLQDQIPVVHPVVDYNYLFADPVFGGELRFDSNVTSLSREAADFDRLNTACNLNNPDPTNCMLIGAPGEYNRFTTTVSWRRSFTTNNGQVITPYLAARGDVYTLDIDSTTYGGVALNNFIGTGDRTVTRGMATAAVEWRWPFVISDNWGFQIIEPIVQVIARPGSEPDAWYVPNEDAQSVVFDDTTLFDYDKFSGYDRIEVGTRANVGFKYTLQTKSGHRVRGVFGQSFHLAGNNPFPVGSGLETDRSDYVAATYYDVTNRVTLATRFRLDEDNFKLQRHELGASYNGESVTATLTYANISPVPQIGYTSRREEVRAAGKLLLTHGWSVFGHARYDLTGTQWVSNSLGIGYDNDCFGIALTYDRQYVRDGDILPDETIYLRFTFRTLGEQEFGTSINED